jgi:hypothetical protein
MSNRFYFLNCEKCGDLIKSRTWYKRKTKLCKGCIPVANPLSKKHGQTKTKLFKRWMAIFERIKLDSYKKKGVVVCEEWKDFMTFKRWSEQNGFHESLELDRIDNNGNYEPSNCQWITTHEHAKKDNGVSVYCVELNREFRSMREASLFVGRSISAVSKSIIGNHRCGGFTWKRVDK